MLAGNGEGRNKQEVVPVVRGDSEGKGGKEQQLGSGGGNR